MNIVINSKQANPAYMKNGYNNGTEFWNSNYRPYIRTINFGNDLSNLPSNCTESNLCWDITESRDNKVYGYLIDSGLKDSTDSTKSLYNLYIVIENEIFAPSSCSWMFANFDNLILINLNNNFNTIKTIYMAYIFYKGSLLSALDLSNFNTTNVINMSGMFTGCSNIEQLNLSNFDTSKLTSMWHMFYGSTSLTTLELSSFNTINVTDWTIAFYGCTKINTTITIRNASITDYAEVFKDAATDPNAKIIVNYTSETETLVDKMIATKSSNSNIIKGKQI